MDETIHHCTECRQPLLPDGCKLRKLMEYASKLNLTYSIVGEHCDEFQLEVWDPDQEC